MFFRDEAGASAAAESPRDRPKATEQRQRRTEIGIRRVFMSKTFLSFKSCPFDFAMGNSQLSALIFRDACPGDSAKAFQSKGFLPSRPPPAVRRKPAWLRRAVRAQARRHDSAPFPAPSGAAAEQSRAHRDRTHNPEQEFP